MLLFNLKVLRLRHSGLYVNRTKALISGVDLQRTNTFFEWEIHLNKLSEKKVEKVEKRRNTEFASAAWKMYGKLGAPETESKGAHFTVNNEYFLFFSCESRTQIAIALHSISILLQLFSYFRVEFNSIYVPKCQWCLTSWPLTPVSVGQEL